MYSSPPNGNREEAAEESGAENVDSDFVVDSESSEDESEGDDYEVVPPIRSERRSKMKHDSTAAPGVTMVSSSQHPKRGRVEVPESTEKTAKQPKLAVPKTQRALPRIKVVVPIAST
jgi:hypothetical protein